MSALIEVALIDDHAVFRDGLRLLLERENDRRGRIKVTHQASTGNAFLASVNNIIPPVVVLDVETGGSPAAAIILELRRRDPAVTVIVLTMHSEPRVLDPIRQAGATLILNKASPSSTVIDAIFKFAKSPTAAQLDDLAHPLTGREVEVLELLSRARSNQEIARELHIETGTVKRHISNLLKKLDAHSRWDAVVRARNERIIAG